MDPFGMGGFDFMFNVFPIIFMIMFCTILGIFIVTAIRGVKEYKDNNASPILTVDAKVVAKRGDVSRNHHHDDTGAQHSSSSTTYFVTFEVESGDRMEFRVSGKEYGMLVEGDLGKLTFQGTRYQGFKRIREE